MGIVQRALRCTLQLRSCVLLHVRMLLMRCSIQSVIFTFRA